MDSTTNSNEVAGQVRSRRAVMVGVLGGLGAWATTAVTRRVSPAHAAAGDPIRMGQGNDAAGTETGLSTNSDGPALTVRQDGRGWAIQAESDSENTALFAWNRLNLGDGGSAIDAVSANGTAILARSERGKAIIATALNDTPITASSERAAAIIARSVHGRAIEASSVERRAIFASSVSKSGVHAQSENGAALYAVSTNGDGLVARHRTGPGWAGRFHGDVLIQGNCTLKERPSTPAAPAADRAQLFLRDNGSGKSELCVQFATGPVQVLATEP